MAGTCGLRAGELKGLQRNDIAPDGSTVRVERGVTYRAGEFHVGDPKTEAGKRTVSVPEFVRADLVAHMKTVGKARTALVFPSLKGAQYMTDWELRYAVEKAGRTIGLDGSDSDHKVLRPHELRHTAATLFARSGATTADLMARIGHTTAAMAVRYQHATEERDAEIAATMSKMFAD